MKSCFAAMLAYGRLTFFLLAFVIIFTLNIKVSSAYQPNTSLNSLGNNSWLQVNQGSVTAHRNIMSYSGGWYDSAFHQFCIFGGGHWDYSGNEVWCFDITNETWSRIYQPDVVVSQGGNYGPYYNYDNSSYPGAVFNPAGENIADALPHSKHSYDQMEYVDGLGPIMWGGYSWGDGGQGWCDECNDSWAFNHTGAKWLYLYDGSNPSPNTAAGVGASAYSTTEGLMYVQARWDTWTYNPANNQWTQIPTTGSAPGVLHATMEYDPNRNMFYLFGGDYPVSFALYSFNPSTRVWTQLNPSGTAPSGNNRYTSGPGVAFDTFNDVLLVYHSSNIWVYDPDTNNWSKPAVPGNAPTDTDQVYGRFRFDPINNGAWYHGWANGQHTTWFYRYQNTANRPAPVISIIANPPTLASGDPISLSWAVSNGSSCTASGDWSGSKNMTGTEVFNIAGSNATFTLNCSGPGGSGNRSISISNAGIGGGGSSGSSSGGSSGGSSSGGSGGSSGGSSSGGSSSGSSGSGGSSSGGSSGGSSSGGSSSGGSSGNTQPNDRLSTNDLDVTNSDGEVSSGGGSIHWLGLMYLLLLNSFKNTLRKKNS